MLHKIALYSPEEGDGCSFYRGSGALGELFRDDVAVMRCPPRISWPEFSDCSVAFMQRPFNDLHIQVAKMLKSQMPLWIDYDDDLANVPISNPAHWAYTDPDLKKNLRTLANMADVITVSTAELAKKYGGAKVIPNAYNDYRLSTDFAPPEAGRKRPIVLWRGTESHQGDLMAFKPQLDRLIKDLPGVDFAFFGYYPWMLDNHAASNVIYFPKRDVFQYFQMLDKIRPNVVIVPLEDNALNRAKSNIAHLETARFGAITVAPNWEEWRIPGIMRYNTPNEMVAAVRSIVTAAPTYAPGLQDNWSEILETYALSNINTERMDIYRSLT